MTGPLYAIGRWCSRHHWPVIGAWVALAIALLVIGGASGSKTSENLTLPGTGSTQSTELLEENLPEQAYGSNPLVLEAPAGSKLTEGKYAKAVEETAEEPDQVARRQLGDEPARQGLPDAEPEGPEHRLHPRRPRGRSRRNRRRSVAGNPRRGEAFRSGRRQRRDRRLRRQPALQTVDREVRADRTDRGGDHPALRLRHGDGDDAADPRRAGRADLHADGYPPARARARGPRRGLDAGDDDRPRRRHRLRALHRHPAQTPAEGRHGGERVDRPRDRDRGRRRRLRRLHRGDRALLARRRRDPAGDDARVHRGGRGGDRGLRGGDAPARDARRARPAHQQPPVPSRQDASGRKGGARLAALGGTDREGALALGDRGAGRPRDPGAADLQAAAGSERHQRAAGGNDLAPGLRRVERGLRSGRQRAAADRLAVQLGRGSAAGSAGTAESDRRRARTSSR